MKLPNESWQDSPGMMCLLAALDASQGQTRFVGGCVRDTLLGADVSDVDLATRFQPAEVMSRLAQASIKAVPTGLSHGTVTAVVAEGPVEITTLRRDVSTDGRRATVAFTEDWREDAARRDFTINALFADPASRDLFDYFGGLDDLEAGRVRFIGDPLQRIAEDHLRILRFFRFHARFGRGMPEARDLDACTARANDLMALSRERIADELLKLLSLPRPERTVALMVERGIFRPVLPQIDQSGVDALTRLTEREQQAKIAPDPVRRLAALLPPDPDVASAIAAQLRLSNRKRNRLVAAAGRGARDFADARLLAYRIGRDEAVDRLLLDEDSDRLEGALRELQGWKRPRLPITGGDLIAMGLSPGPLVARTLRSIEDAWATGGFEADEDEVRSLARRHVDQLLRSSQ